MVEIDKKAKIQKNKYILLRVLDTELYKSYADMYSAIRRLDIQITNKGIDAILRYIFGYAETLMLGNIKQLESLLNNLLIQTESNWLFCNTTPYKSTKDWIISYYQLLVCISEHRFLVSILESFAEYLEKMDFIEPDKLDKLIKVINGLQSTPVLNALYYVFERKIKEELNNSNTIKKIIYGESIDLQDLANYYSNIYQKASNEVKNIIKYLLEDPEKNIKEFIENAKIPENYIKHKEEIETIKQHYIIMETYLRMLN